MLFLIPILDQTTTVMPMDRANDVLFLIPILDQTTTQSYNVPHEPMLFLIPILDQTTTIAANLVEKLGCSLFQFLIKPQPSPPAEITVLAVPYSNS